MIEGEGGGGGGGLGGEGGEGGEGGGGDGGDTCNNFHSEEVPLGWSIQSRLSGFNEPSDEFL